MVLGIISAMPEEVQSLIDALEHVTLTEKGMRSYYHGYFKQQELVVVFSRWGKVASAITATQLCNDYKVSEIIFTGVSGSLDTCLEIGDIVIGTQLYQHDMDARPLFDQFEIPLLGVTSFSCKNSLALEEAAALFTRTISDYIPLKKLSEFSIQKVSVTKGLILSGDQFISSKEKVAELKAVFPEALCVEMEGASVAQVCYEYKVPFSIIRIISDNANADAAIDFPAFTKAVACKYAKQIIENYLELI